MFFCVSCMSVFGLSFCPPCQLPLWHRSMEHERLQVGHIISAGVVEALVSTGGHHGLQISGNVCRPQLAGSLEVRSPSYRENIELSGLPSALSYCLVPSRPRVPASGKQCCLLDPHVSLLPFQLSTTRNCLQDTDLPRPACKMAKSPPTWPSCMASHHQRLWLPRRRVDSVTGKCSCALLTTFGLPILPDAPMWMHHHARHQSLKPQRVSRLCHTDGLSRDGHPHRTWSPSLRGLVGAVDDPSANGIPLRWDKSAGTAVTWILGGSRQASRLYL